MKKKIYSNQTISKKSRDKRNGIIIIIVLAIIMTAILLLTYKSKIQEGNKDHNILSVKEISQTITLSKDSPKLEQTFLTPSDDMNSIGIFFGQFNLLPSSSIRIFLSRKGENGELASWQFGEDVLRQGRETYVMLSLPEIAQYKEGTAYIVSITTENFSETDTVEICTTKAIKEIEKDGQTLKIGGELQEHNIAIQATTDTTKVVTNLFFLLSILSLSFLFLLGYLILRKKCKIEQIFLVLALFFGVLYMFLLPPYSTPDEANHIATAYANSNQMLHQDVIDESGNVIAREGDDIINARQFDSYGNPDKYTHANPNGYTYQIIFEHLFEKNENAMTGSLDLSPLNVTRIGYLPQVVGITIGRLLEFGQIPMLMLGRLCGLLFYIGCCTIAIKKIPFGKMILFTVALLPMSMQQAISFSYDVVVNALAFLFIGYTFYLAYEKEKIDVKDIVLLTVIATLLAPCKVVYILICFLCLLIPKKKFSNKKYFYMSILIIIMAATISLLIQNIAAISSLTSNGERLIGWANEPGYILSDLLHNPLKLIRIIGETIRQHSDFYLLSMLGGALGMLEISIPWVYLIGFLLVLFLAAQTVEGDKLVFKMMDRSWCLLIACGVIGAVCLSLLLDFTPSTSNWIEGVQGRYFLPILPLLFLTMRNKTLILKRSIDSSLILTIFMLQFLTVLRVFETIIGR